MRDEARYGTFLGVGAYTIWGLFPLYWPLLEPAASIEILGHRVVWSLLAIALALLVQRKGLPRVPLRRFLLLAGAAVFIAVNWGVYIYGVNHDHVVETSLGYFINPLVNVLLGVLVLRERLRRAQWSAVGVAALAVVILTFNYGRVPWISLILASSFGIYGLLKKFAHAAALDGLAIETIVLAPIALGYLLITPDKSFASHGADHALLLIGTGFLSVLPLLLFGGAITRLPLSSLGVLQYIAPTLQFLIGVAVRHEPLPAVRLVGFAIVWVALAIFTYDGVTHARRTARPDFGAESLV